MSYPGQMMSYADRLILVGMVAGVVVGGVGPLPEPPAAGTDLTLVCLSLTLHRATTHSCGHPATGSALISHAPSERRQSHGTRPPDRTKRQSQMNAGGARSAALGGRDGGVVDGLECLVQLDCQSKPTITDNAPNCFEYW